MLTIFGKDKDKGFDKIRSVIGKFEAMKDELIEGISMLFDEKNANEQSIAELHERNVSIQAEIEKAEHVKSQLIALTGGTD